MNTRTLGLQHTQIQNSIAVAPTALSLLEPPLHIRTKTFQLIISHQKSPAPPQTSHTTYIFAIPLNLLKRHRSNMHECWGTNCAQHHSIRGMNCAVNEYCLEYHSAHGRVSVSCARDASSNLSANSLFFPNLSFNSIWKYYSSHYKYGAHSRSSPTFQIHNFGYISTAYSNFSKIG